MALARKLQAFERKIDALLKEHEETLAQVQRRNGPGDAELINSIEETLGHLADAHVMNTDARSFERVNRQFYGRKET